MKKNFEKFPKTELEDNKETLEPEEKILNPEEIEVLGEDMSEYVKGLKTRIDEIEQELKDEKIDKDKKSELETELEELKEQHEGLKGMADNIQSGDFEEITERPIKQEVELESIPISEDIKSIFEKLLKGKEYETIRKLEDEQGLYLWEIKIPEEDGHTEYLYMRKGRHAEGGQASNTAIHIAFFDEEDFPVSGSSVAKYIDGKWKLTP